MNPIYVLVFYGGGGLGIALAVRTIVDAWRGVPGGGDRS